MAEKMRYNKIIDLLEHGKPVFSTSTVPNGSLDDLTYIHSLKLPRYGATHGHPMSQFA